MKVLGNIRRSRGVIKDPPISRVIRIQRCADLRGTFSPQSPFSLLPGWVQISRQSLLMSEMEELSQVSEVLEERGLMSLKSFSPLVYYDGRPY